MNFYEHTLITRQDVSPSQVKQLEDKYTKKIKKEITYILKSKVKVKQ